MKVRAYKYRDDCYVTPKDVFLSCYQWLSKGRGGKNSRQSVVIKVKFWLAGGIYVKGAYEVR